MAELVFDNNTPVNLSSDDFKKIFHHLCLAAKKQAKHPRKDVITPLIEKRIISEKIDAVEKKEHQKSDDWIKNRLLQTPRREERVMPQRQTDSKEAEIREIKNHILEIKKSYEILKLKKGVSKEKLKALKDRILKLERMIKK